MPPAGDKKWFWCVGEQDSDYWYGPFDTRDQAIEDAQSPDNGIEFLDHETNVFHVVEAPYGGAEITLDFLYFANKIISKHDEEFSSDDGEWSDEVGLTPDHRADLAERIQKAVGEWREANSLTGHYHVHSGTTDYERHTLGGGQ